MRADVRPVHVSCWILGLLGGSVLAVAASGAILAAATTVSAGLLSSAGYGATFTAHGGTALAALALTVLIDPRDRARRADRPRRWARAPAVAAAGLAMLFGPLDLLLPICAVLVLLADATEPGARSLGVQILVAGGWLAANSLAGGAGPSTLALTAAGVLALGVWSVRRPDPGGPWALATNRLQAGLVGLGCLAHELLGTLAGGDGLPVLDTLLAAVGPHALGLSLLVPWLRVAFEGTPNRRVALSLFAMGSAALLGGFFLLGRLGQPRRYASWQPDGPHLAALHLSVAAGGVVVTGIVVASWLAWARREPPSP